MRRRPPRSTRYCTLLPYSALVRSTVFGCRLCAKEILAAAAQRPTNDRADSRRGKERHGFGDVLWLATLRQRAEATADFAWADRHRPGPCRFDEARFHCLDRTAALGKSRSHRLEVADDAGHARPVIGLPGLAGAATDRQHRASAHTHTEHKT